MPSRRQSSAILSSPRSPSRTMRIFSSAEKCRRVARRMSLIASSAGCFSGPNFCLIFAPCGYDDPEILPTRKPPTVSKALTADNAAVIVSLTRTVAFRGEAEMRSNIARFREALGRIDARPIGEGHNHADTGNGHQPAADGITQRQLLAESIEPFELFEERLRTSQNCLGDRKQNGIVRNEFQYPRLEPSPGHDTDPQAENL